MEERDVHHHHNLGCCLCWRFVFSVSLVESTNGSSNRAASCSGICSASGNVERIPADLFLRHKRRSHFVPGSCHYCRERHRCPVWKTSGLPSRGHRPGCDRVLGFSVKELGVFRCLSCHCRPLYGTSGKLGPGFNCRHMVSMHPRSIFQRLQRDVQVYSRAGY